MRFWRGQPQVIGGWESLTGDRLSGVCRRIFAWADHGAELNLAFGCHASLEIWRGGGLFDITPLRAQPPCGLAPDPLTVTAGSAEVVVTWPGHGLADGANVALSGASALGGTNANTTSAAVRVVDADHLAFDAAEPAASSASGGGAACEIQPLAAFEAGAVDGAGGAGFGTGAFSTGGYSAPSQQAFYPRTWSLAAFGQNLVANPRGGTIHVWRNDPAERAAPLKNAPRQVTCALVSATDQIFALGCSEEVSGIFNPMCVRHSGVRAPEVWHTGPGTTAREYVLAGGGRIVGALPLGAHLLIWTTDRLFLGSYVGALNQPWRFEPVGEACGLIGPNAAAASGGQAVWLAPDLQFRRYVLGGAVEVLACPIREEMAAHLTPGQADKITASTLGAFDEMRFDYPDRRDGVENSRYLTLSLQDGAWSRGLMARSALVDAGPQENPVGAAPDGALYWHERGRSADGAALSWFIESADQYLDPDRTLMVRSLWPDLADQTGAAALTLKGRLTPQGPERTYGPYALAPGQPRVDLRATGRLFRLRLSGHGAPTGGRLGAPMFDVTPAGNR